jgi:hypothetical protein
MPEPIKLKQSQIKGTREHMLASNKGICPICKRDIAPQDAALDHDHKTGYIRDTLHRDCNSLLGKIENFIARYSIRLRNKEVLQDYLSNVATYIHADYTENPLHPSHKTAEDKQIKQYKNRMKRAKLASTKAKYKKLIQEYQEGQRK